MVATPLRPYLFFALGAFVLAAAGAMPAAGQAFCERPRQALERVYAATLQDALPFTREFEAAALLARSGAACRGVGTARTAASRHDEARDGCPLADYEDPLRSYDLFAPLTLPAPDSMWFAVLFGTRGFHHQRLGHTASALRDYATAATYAASSPVWLRAPLLIDAATAHLCTGDARSAHVVFSQADELLAHADTTLTALALLQALAGHGSAASLMAAPGDRAAALGTLAARLRRVAHRYAGAGLPHLQADVLILLAEIEDARGTEAAVLLPLLQRARALARRHGAVDSHVRLALLHARVERRTGRALNARTALETAYEHAVLADRFSLATLRVLNALGAWHESRGTLDAAAVAYTWASRIVDVQRARRPAAVIPLNLLRDEQAPFRGRARVHLASGAPDAAFLVLEQARGRYLQDLRAYARLAATLTGAERIAHDRLSAAIERIRNQLATSLPAKRMAELQREEVRLVLARDALVRRVVGSEVPALGVMRSHLRKRGAVLISYFVSDGRPAHPPASYAFVIDARGLTAVPLPGVSTDTLRALVDQVSPALRAPDRALGLEGAAFSLGALHRLYRLLVAPIADRLPDGAPLIVIPEGPLVELPFGLLIEEPATAYLDAPYLLRKHPISIESAAAFLVDPPTPPGHGLAAFGKSSFEDLRTVPDALLNEGTHALDRLPDVPGEVIAAAAVVTDGHAHLNSEATEPAFLAALRTASVVHVASHTLVRSSDPARSGVVLTPGDGADGIVYAHELQTTPARADLVVLSGCDTARGHYRSGEGMVGLHYALRAAGVRATIATHWRVDDAAMRKILSAFYHHIGTGRPKDEALRQAQLDYLAEAGPVSASPFFWAAPVLYGDAAPHRLGRPPRAIAAHHAAGALAALLVLGAALRARRRRER